MSKIIENPENYNKLCETMSWLKKYDEVTSVELTIANKVVQYGIYRLTDHSGSVVRESYIYNDDSSFLIQHAYPATGRVSLWNAGRLDREFVVSTFWKVADPTRTFGDSVSWMDVVANDFL